MFEFRSIRVQVFQKLQLQTHITFNHITYYNIVFILNKVSGDAVPSIYTEVTNLFFQLLNQLLLYTTLGGALVIQAMKGAQVPGDRID